ncbi:hypothetical protein ABEB36_004738 [Hypothenemus hampei]|uniref:Uncharacterized protein n=1 Tax=Hypothenemus hampei TaxID=57062 RepID=A0ABD1F4A0_HYPHA
MLMASLMTYASDVSLRLYGAGDVTTVFRGSYNLFRFLCSAAGDGVAHSLQSVGVTVLSMDLPASSSYEYSKLCTELLVEEFPSSPVRFLSAPAWEATGSAGQLLAEDRRGPVPAPSSPSCTGASEFPCVVITGIGKETWSVGRKDGKEKEVVPSPRRT